MKTYPYNWSWMYYGTTYGHVNLKKKTPVISSLFSEINDTMGTIYEVSSKIKSKANSCDFFRRNGE